MKYKVLKMFTDLQDNRYVYNVDDTYPREGIEPTESRIAELSGKFNKQGVPLIEAVEETAEGVTEDIPEAEETEEDKPKKRTRRKTDEE
jgi:hypothetical protein